MDLLLLSVTLVSLSAALGFGALTWRLSREERRRSAARVAALAAAIHEDPVRHDRADAEPFAPVRVGALFERAPGGTSPGLPIIKLAAAAAMAVVVIVLVALSNARPDAPAKGAATPQGAPLELVSMRHVRDAEARRLTVSGLVRNPQTGGRVERVTAVVFAFNRAGEFVSSGRAPLDFVALTPGDESPFVVRLDNVEDVGRYRVSFRTEEGVVRHVDRRTGTSGLASAVHPVTSR